LTDAQRNAYAQAVERHSDCVYRLAMVYLRNPHDARDCCQDVFVKLMERKRGFESEEHRRAWLLAVTKNTCRDQLRRETRRRTDSLESVGDLPGLDGSGEDLLALILALPPSDREVLYLHCCEGYHLREICALLRLRESAAKQRLFRARERLRALLDE
jgi:RNA polymerase sigma-70 factor (ECF subfamily)